MKKDRNASGEAVSAGDRVIVPDGSSTSEIEIKKSKFIGICCPVSDEKEARKIVSETRSTHKSARHVVYAFICGTEASSIMGMSDDGEPKGTAGKPVLQVLKGSRITNILCMVVRYFGGIKLGTGGLVRAYTESAQASIANLKTKTLVEEKTITFSISYEFHDQVLRYLTSLNRCRIISEDFLTDISISISVPESEACCIADKIKEATSGRAVFR